MENLKNMKENAVRKQLELLSKKSESANSKELCELTNAMIGLIRVTVPQNQSFYEAETHHPYVVQLPAKDLVDLYAVRAELYTQTGLYSRKSGQQD